MKKKIISLFLTVAMIALLITPFSAITASAADVSLDASKLQTGTGLATFTTNESVGGRTGVLKVNTTSNAGIRYLGINNMSAATAGTVRYLLVDIYYEKASATTTPYGISTAFRQINDDQNNWNMWNYQENGSYPYRNVSSGLSALPNRWQTIAIDCQAAMNYLSTNSASLYGMQINLPQAASGDYVYVDSVRFSDTTGDYEFGRTATIMADNGVMKNPETVDYAGKTGVQQFTVSSGEHGIRYGSMHMGYAYASANRYLLADCYLADGSADDFSMSVVFRKVNNDQTWINSNASSTQTSGTYPTNRWVTVAIDCAAPLASLATNKQSLTQLQINLSATTGTFYVESVRFAAEAPPQMVFTDANGLYTYLSEDGEVTVNGDTIPAYTNTTDAFNALGAQGGTVYLEGNLSAFTDVANGARGAILFRGLGDTAEDIAANVLYQINAVEIKGADITFDYLTVAPYPNAESGTNYTSFFTCQTNAAPIKHITLGEHMVSTGMALGIRKGKETLYPNRDVFTVNGGTYYAITPLTNYGTTTLNRLGTVDWTLNGGTVHNLYAGSNNSWEYENSQIRGDVKYTINGGIFDGRMVMGSGYGSTEIQGNIIWTINGGNMAGRTIVGGDEHVTKGNRTQQYLNNVAAIVNLKGGKAGLSTLTLGTAGAKGLDINGNEIYILNNYEDNLGTQIAAGSLAEYKLHVYHGKAEPVFAESQTTTVNGSTVNFGGSLTGFTLTPDEVGEVPYVNGVKATATNGIYTITPDPSGIIEIVFAPEGTYGVSSFREDGGEVKAQMYNFTNTAVPMMVLVAEYQTANGSDTLTNVWLNTYSVASGSTRAESVSYSETPGYTYRAFVWDGSLAPLWEMLEL